MRAWPFVLVLGFAVAASSTPRMEATLPLDERPLLRPGGSVLTYRPGPAAAGPLLDLDDNEYVHLDEGRTLYYRDWLEDPGEPLAGPTFDATDCASCHAETAAAAPAEIPQVVRVTSHEIAGTVGWQLNAFHINRGAARPAVATRWINRTLTLADGTKVDLRRPVVTTSIDGADVPLTLRVAPTLFGWGLLENVSAEYFRHFHDPDDRNGDGISGRLVESNAGKLAFLGWKNTQASVRDQVAAALAADMGVISADTCAEPCTTEISEAELDALADYVRYLPVPHRRQTPNRLGQDLFGQTGCSSCHVSVALTRDDGAPEFAAQLIWPYTDLMLHDMGPGLADPGDTADAREWRTAPLWGLGYIEARLPERGFLHDGRARNIEEAILWHGGEAAAAQQRYTELSVRERAALLAYVRAL